MSGKFFCVYNHKITQGTTAGHTAAPWELGEQDHSGVTLEVRPKNRTRWPVASVDRALKQALEYIGLHFKVMVCET